MSWRIIDIKPGDPVPPNLVYRGYEKAMTGKEWDKWCSLEHPSAYASSEFAVYEPDPTAEQQMRRQAWIQFAAACLSDSYGNATSADVADRMIAEFDKRVNEGAMSELTGWTFQKIEDKRQTLADVPDGWEGLATEGDDSLVKLMRVENSVVYDIFGDGEKRPARLGKLAYRVYNPEPVKMPAKAVPQLRCYRLEDDDPAVLLRWNFANGVFYTLYTNGAITRNAPVINGDAILMPRVAKLGVL